MTMLHKGRGIFGKSAGAESSFGYLHVDLCAWLAKSWCVCMQEFWLLEAYFGVVVARGIVSRPNRPGSKNS